MTKRILLVDDDIPFLHMIEVFLKESEFNVTTATDGREASSLLTSPESCFDLLITDLIMPTMTGSALVKWVRHIPSLNSLPIILLSGQGTVTNIARTMQLGNVVYLCKPVGMVPLMMAIEQFIPAVQAG